jgi:hypothetical protein
MHTLHQPSKKERGKDLDIGSQIWRNFSLYLSKSQKLVNQALKLQRGWPWSKVSWLGSI